MNNTGRKIAAKPLDFSPGQPAVTPVERASAPTEPEAKAPASELATAPSVGGLKGVVVYLEPTEAVALKVYAAQNNTSIQQLGTEAFAALFQKHSINGGVLTRVRANRKHGGNR